MGPDGGEMLSKALLNSGMKLEEIYAGRNRLESDGYTAIAEALKEMGSLRVIEMPQNFVKKEGMLAMIEAFKANPALEVVAIHDNWLKEEAIGEFCKWLESHSGLRELNISDCDIGGLGVWQIFRALAISPSRTSIEQIRCHYNDLERSKTVREILKAFKTMTNLKYVSLVGNEIKPQLKAELEDHFKAVGATLSFKEEGDDELGMDDEEEDAESVSDEEEEQEDDLTEQAAKWTELLLSDLSIGDETTEA
jgi:Ran GTPase-activating protein 1